MGSAKSEPWEETSISVLELFGIFECDEQLHDQQIVGKR